MSARNNGTATDNGVTITFEICTTASGSSSPVHTPSPSTPVNPPSSSYTLDASEPSEDSWNLIPYDVPWGPDYYHYSRGTLPGPDGACIFLRSPTPLKNKRTQTACNKCRQRKAKCSGDRPACTRCLARGYICEYVEEERRPVHASPPRGSHLQRDSSEEPSDETEASSPEVDCPSPEVQLFAPPALKMEDSDFSTPDLLYADNCSTSDTASTDTDFRTTWDDAQYGEEARYWPPQCYQGTSAMEYYDPPSYPGNLQVGDVQVHAYPPGDISTTYAPKDASQAPAGLHAPRPVRCVGSPSFLVPPQQPGNFPCEGHIFRPDDMLVDLSHAAQPAPQIAIPHVPPMPSANGTTVHGGAFDYSYPPPMYYCQAPMPQYPALQYQYSVPTYVPGLQDHVEPSTLYTMVATGMAS
ncbi:hypothetical protein BD414DRAFT_449065 [Trametes punicea]|nr:hypothetical protein BD414DRAFT_449065 [Trametes punicea]